MKTEEIDRRIGMPDIDKEWAKFEEQAFRPTRNVKLWNRAAVVIGVVFGLSAVAMASILLLEHAEPEKTIESSVETPVNPEKLSAVASQADIIVTDSLTIDNETFRFDNVEMQTIAEALGEYYQVEPVFENDDARRLRLYVQIEKSKSIEQVVEFLNNFHKVQLRLEAGKLMIR